MRQCDEHRPNCLLCANSDRACHYPVQVPVSTSSPELPRERIIQFTTQDDTSSTECFSTPTHPHISPDPSPSAIFPPHPNDDASESINLAHMDLLIHITLDSSMFNLGAGMSSYHSSGLALGLKVALAHPYLMHALLAFSALHLTHLHPERSEHYLDLSVRLQTRAIELFNSAYDGVREGNCVPIVLFSSILGHHVLASTLGFRSQMVGDLEGIVGQYVQCMDTHRGIHTIATSSWPALMASEIAPILMESKEFTSREPVGSYCDVLIRRIEVSDEMGEDEKEACRMAVGYLQVGFDATENEEEDGEMNRHHMIYTWTMLVPREVTGLLVRMQPEAVALLAYYAVLLHRGRDFWQVGDAGPYLFRLADAYLGEEWNEVMEGPRREISGGHSI